MAGPPRPRKKKPPADAGAELRRQAEKRLDERASPASDDVGAAVHELRVHQIELELQNEELRRTTEQLEASRERYFDLYDHAPVGYLTCGEDGIIRMANVTVAGKVGVPVPELIGEAFTRFVAAEDQDVFYLLTRALFKTGRPRSCELRLRSADGTQPWVHVDAVLADDGPGGDTVCRATLTDITALRLAADELHEREQNFRTFFDTVDDIIAVASPDGRLVYANPATSARLGYTADELGRMRVPDLYPPDLRDPVEAIAAATLRGECDVCTLSLRSRSGALVPVETRVWLGQWNGVPCIFSVSKDLTEEREALQKFDRLFHGSPALMTVSTVPDGRFTEVNEAFLAASGYSREEVVGHTSEELGVFVDPERQQQLIVQLQTRGRVSEWELEVRCKDGTILDGLFSAEVVTSQAQTYALVVMVDQTDRKRAEEKLRASEEQLACAVEGSGVGLWDWYVQTGEETFNERWAEIAGYTLAELAPLSIETWRKLTHPDDLRRADELLEEHFSRRSPIYSCEARVRHKEGHWVWVLDQGKVSEWDDDGRPIRMTGTALDISSRKAGEEEIATALSLLESTLESTADGIMVADGKGAILRFNARFLEIWGIPEVIAASRDDDAAIGFVLDQLEEPEKFAETVRDLYAAPERTSFDVLALKDGRVLERYSQPQRIDGSVVGRVWSFREVTERKRAETEIQERNTRSLRLIDELLDKTAALEEANTTITRIAATDELTGLANRRHFYEALEKAVSLARRHGSPMALLSLDLDGLKSVNDEAGHAAGDETLATFAALLGDSCRAEDLPGRLGGDEFGVLLPGIDLDGARGFARRVLEAVRSCTSLARRGVTVSGGVVCWTSDELPDHLLRRADDALYAAKRAGGDAVAGG